MADRQVLLQQLRYHNSFYLYEESCILDSIHRLKDNFPGAQFLYSMKCNPAGRVLDTVFSQGIGADAASLGEVDAAWKRGVSPDLIYFSAPARTEADLRAAWGRCVLIADSLHELEMIRRIDPCHRRAHQPRLHLGRRRGRGRQVRHRRGGPLERGSQRP